MKKYFIKGFCLILCSVFACVFNGCINTNNTDFEKNNNTVFVKTKACGYTDISYFELNDNGDFRECDEFEPNVNEYYITDGFILNDNSVEYAFNNMGENFYNSKLERVTVPGNVKKALYAVDDFEGRKEHWIWVERVFVCGDKCYIVAGFNVNWQTPYSLLEYDEKNNSLKEIMYISDEQIIGLKIIKQ